MNAHAKSCLTLETTADTPVRNQGPGRSLPGPDAGHPCTVWAVTIQQPSTATTPASGKHELSPTLSASWGSGQPPSTAASSGRRGCRAISGLLATVISGQPRTLTSIKVPSSAALIGVRHTPSKLVMRVRFPSPAPQVDRASPDARPKRARRTSRLRGCRPSG